LILQFIAAFPENRAEISFIRLYRYFPRNLGRPSKLLKS